MPISTTYYNFKPAGCVDVNATAFTLAAGITNPTQKEAVCVLVTALKAAGIWTKFRAIWPYVGGNATAHSYNLIDPAKFQLAFFNAFVHNALGVTGDGVSTYATTGFFPMTEIATQAQLDNLSIGSYSTVVGDSYDMGSWNGANNYIIGLKKGNDGVFTTSSLSAYIYSPTNTGFTNGLSYIQRNSSQMEFYQGTNLQKTLTKVTDYEDSTQGGMSNIELSLFALDNIVSPTAGRCSLHFIGEYMNLSERAAFYSAVQAYQTTLGRQL